VSGWVGVEWCEWEGRCEWVGGWVYATNAVCAAGLCATMGWLRSVGSIRL